MCLCLDDYRRRNNDVYVSCPVRLLPIVGRYASMSSIIHKLFALEIQRNIFIS